MRPRRPDSPDAAPDGRAASAALAHARTRASRDLCGLARLLAIPSVSSDPARRGDARRAADFLVAHLRRLGFDGARAVDTSSNPLVLAEWLHAPGRPTLLLYGHYDVQPAGGRWRSPPFRPVLRAGRVFARGASDDKGQLWCHLSALDACLASSGRLPVNVRVILDGDEETGSGPLLRYVARHAASLRADAALMSDTRMFAPDRPALIVGLRGGLGLNVTALGPPRDLHSGHFGGAVANPAQALAGILASLHDRRGRIAVPGLYDQVRRRTPEQRQRLNRLGVPEARILQDAGVPRGAGELGFTAYERLTTRPALIIQRLAAGAPGRAPHSVIPASASAQLRFRLVPDQSAAEVERLVRDHLARLTPPGVRLHVETFMRAEPALIHPRHPAMLAARRALRRTFGSPVRLLRSGGSIPVVESFQRELHIPTVLMGFALAEDNAHGPDESFGLDRLAKGAEASIRFLHLLAADRGAGLRPWWGRREAASLSLRELELMP